MKHALTAADLLDACILRVRDAIKLDEGRQHGQLYEMEGTLMESGRLLRDHLVRLLELDLQASSQVIHSETRAALSGSLQDVVDALRSSNLANETLATTSSPTKQSRRNETPSSDMSPPKRPRSPVVDRSSKIQYYTSRSVTDKLLFRLIVVLQLCLVRIEDAFLVLRRRQSLQSTVILLAGGAGCTALLLSKRDTPTRLGFSDLMRVLGKSAVVTLTMRWTGRGVHNLWMSSKLMKSKASLLDWQQQWLLVQASRVRSPSTDSMDSLGSNGETISQRLLEYNMSHQHKVSGWGSFSEIRFLFIKRTMNLFYAAVGTAVELTRSSTSNNPQGSWKKTLATVAAASYYSVTGPSKRASEVVSSQSSELIRSAWGLVSLPSVKQLSLQASRLAKGAAVADRIVIAGVSCFILCRDPFPELSAALRRYRRQEKRRSFSNLTTIDERPEISGAFVEDLTNYTKKNVVLHITAGGFFAHTIASDIPFLLDWSAKTGAVVICPEYSLLPESPYPVALNEVMGVYGALVGGGAASLLDFQVDRIVLTGESTGGNLATAMSVKLRMEQIGQLHSDQRSEEGSNVNAVVASEREYDMGSDDEINDGDSYQFVSINRLPDAIMLSCPALNLTLDLTPSRVAGVSDPVLPSGLLSTISDAYLPSKMGISKKDPSVSPLYASDEVLRRFPPLLIFASSEGPLLDDSVTFSTRLMRLGLESDLRAAHHMPHAYWGLCTAGFPEARQVQQECQEWLAHQFSRDTAKRTRRVGQL